MARTISHFTIDRSDDDYILQFEDENGEKSEMAASFDQLDLIAEAIDAALDRDEETELGDGDDQARAASDPED